MPGEIYFHKNALSSNYTNGKLAEQLEYLEEKKKITYMREHDVSMHWKNEKPFTKRHMATRIFKR